MAGYRFDQPPPGGAGFLAMTFARYQPVLRRTGSDQRVLARVAFREPDVPAALALAVKEGGDVQLLSLFTRREDRHQGLATGLLQKIEALARQQRADRFFLNYIGGGPTTPHLEALLRHTGWPSPRERSLVIRTDYAHVRTAPWMKERRLPQAMRLVPWFRLDEAVKQQLWGRDWVPEDLDPRRHEGRGVDGATAEPAVSTALLDESGICGWCLTHRLGTHGIRFTSSFVRPDLQKRLLVSVLWRHCVLKAVDIGYREATWTVPMEHPAMRRFADKYMTPYAVETRLAMWAEKQLSATPLTRIETIGDNLQRERTGQTFHEGKHR